MFEAADLIYSYTRARAIEDGVLIDITATAKEEGFKFPCAITTGVFGKIEPDDSALKHGQDLRGRLHDLFWMLRLAIHRSTRPERVDFSLILQDGHREHRTLELYALCHPGDQGEACITIMLLNED